MKKRKPTSKEIIIALVGAVILAGVVFFIYSQISTLNGLRAQLDTEQQTVNNAISNAQKLMLLKEKAPEMEQKIAKIDQLIPSKVNEEVIISEFNHLANHNGIQLIRISFEPQVTKVGYVEIPLNIIVEGRYSALVNLLLDLQSGSRTLRIDEFKLGKGQQELPYLKAEIRASAFYQTGSGNK
jgi:type IV pilus assembly protein PilO